MNKPTSKLIAGRNWTTKRSNTELCEGYGYDYHEEALESWEDEEYSPRKMRRKSCVTGQKRLDNDDTPSARPQNKLESKSQMLPSIGHVKGYSTHLTVHPFIYQNNHVHFIVTTETADELKALGFEEFTLRRQISRRNIQFHPEIGLGEASAQDIEANGNVLVRDCVLKYLHANDHMEISGLAQAWIKHPPRKFEGGRLPDGYRSSVSRCGDDYPNTGTNTGPSFQKNTSPKSLDSSTIDVDVDAQGNRYTSELEDLLARRDSEIENLRAEATKHAKKYQAMATENKKLNEAYKTLNEEYEADVQKHVPLLQCLEATKAEAALWREKHRNDLLEKHRVIEAEKNNIAKLRERLLAAEHSVSEKAKQYQSDQHNASTTISTLQERLRTAEINASGRTEALQADEQRLTTTITGLQRRLDTAERSASITAKELHRRIYETEQKDPASAAERQRAEQKAKATDTQFQEYVRANQAATKTIGEFRGRLEEAEKNDTQTKAKLQAAQERVVGLQECLQVVEQNAETRVTGLQEQIRTSELKVIELQECLQRAEQLGSHEGETRAKKRIIEGVEYTLVTKGPNTGKWLCNNVQSLEMDGETYIEQVALSELRFDMGPRDTANKLCYGRRRFESVTEGIHCGKLIEILSTDMLYCPDNNDGISYVKWSFLQKLDSP